MKTISGAFCNTGDNNNLLLKIGLAPLDKTLFRIERVERAMESVRGGGQFVPDAKIDSLFSIRPIFSTSKFVIDDSAVAVTNPIT